MSESKALAFLFPGQGSQSVGMLGSLAERYTVVRDTFDEASGALGLDLWKLCQEGPEEALNRTDNTQPAMLVAGVAVWRVWRAEGGPEPAFMAGHSLGEYTALCCADALDLPTAARLVRDRGRFMQEAVPVGEGAIAAVLGLDDGTVRDICERAASGEVVDAVNFNAPGQVVIAGAAGAVERALDLAREAGAKRAVPLPMSVPAHSRLMEPASERLRERLAEEDIVSPRIPVIHNTDVTVAGAPGEIRERLVRQVCSPVRWVETMQRLAADGTGRVVECGPGKVLAALSRRIDRSIAVSAVHDPDSLAKALEEVSAA